MAKVDSARTVLAFAVVAILAQSATASEGVEPLLSTHWGQRQEYTKYAPHHHRVGCWSTAFGQILYHHRLFPREGHVHYKCSKEGIVINEDLAAHEFNEGEPFRSTDEVARYLYTIAVIIHKDFGAAGYLLNHQERAEMVEKYFSCTVYLHKGLERNHLAKLLQTELDQGRPVLIHLRDKGKKSFHAAVVDGYKKSNNALLFHINMGHMGKDDAWFRLDQAVGKYDDPTYHLIMTITPNQPQQSAAADADNGRR
jgi:hypothetical protein